MLEQAQHENADCNESQAGLEFHDPRGFQSALSSWLKKDAVERDAFSLVLLRVDGLDGGAEGWEKRELFSEVGRTLQGHIRNTDLLTSFTEGRFALLLSGDDDGGIQRVQDAVLHLLKGRAARAGAPPLSSEGKVWVGRACYPQDGQSVVRLVQQAKERLGEAMRRDPPAPPVQRTRPSTPSRRSHRAEEPPSPETHQPPVRVLLADDEQAVREKLTLLLSSQGYEVEAVDSGEAALLAFGRNPHQVVFTDVEMGGIDGIELLRKLRELSPDVQVIVLVNSATLEIATEVLRAGARDYFVKPLNDGELVCQAARQAAEEARLLAASRARLDQLEHRNAELVRANRMLQELAVWDDLTGLHNQRYLQEVLVREAHRCRRHGHKLSLVVLTVGDYFDRLAAHGALEAERVLRAFAKLLRDCVRRSDLPARVGESAFALLLPETAKPEAAHVAANVLRRAEKLQFRGLGPVPPANLALGVGVATLPEDSWSGADLIRVALEAAEQSPG